MRFWTALAFVVLTGSAQALPLPASVTLPNTATGIVLTFPSLSATDTLSFTVSGIAYEQPGNGYGTNPAGVLVTAGTLDPFLGVGGYSTDPFGFVYGALILSVTGGGSGQVFPVSTATGLGSAAPPTSFTFSGTLGSIVGTVPAGATQLSLRISDTNYADNTGGFTIRATPATAVPEPASMALVAAGLASVVLRRRA